MICRLVEAIEELEENGDDLPTLFKAIETLALEVHDLKENRNVGTQMFTRRGLGVSQD